MQKCKIAVWGGLTEKEKAKEKRPFRYDLNQIPYDYTVEVTSRLKGVDLIDRVTEELWVQHLFRRQ